MTEEERRAFAEGMRAETELRWAGRKAMPNTGFTIAMGIIMGIAGLALLFVAVTTGPWQVGLLGLFFGSGALMAPSVVRQERADAIKAHEILRYYEQRLHPDALTEKENESK